MAQVCGVVSCVGGRSGVAVLVSAVVLHSWHFRQSRSLSTAKKIRNSTHTLEAKCILAPISQGISLDGTRSCLCVTRSTEGGRSRGAKRRKKEFMRLGRAYSFFLFGRRTGNVKEL